jgi:signal transduction histidine kinase
MTNKSSWYHSLQHRLVIYMVFSTFLPLLVLGIASYRLSISGLNDQSNQLTQAVAMQQVSSIERFVRDARRVASHLSGSDSIKEMIQAASAMGELSAIERLRLRARVENRLSSTLSLQGLIAVDVIVNGQVFSIGDLSAGRSFDHSILADWVDYCSQYQQALCWPGIESNTHTDSQYGFVIPALMTVTGFDDASESVEAGAPSSTDATVAKTSPQALLILKYDVSTVYEKVHSSGTGLLYHVLVDNQNRVIYHPHKSRLKTHFSFPQLNLSHGAAMIEGDLNGEPVRIFSQPITALSWTLLSVVDRQLLVREATTIGQLSIAFFVFSSLLMVLASFYVTRKVVRPIQQITEMAKQPQMAGSAPLEKTSIREIEQLIHWFHRYKNVVDNDKAQQAELSLAYQELQQAQDKLIESEKMAALGSIVAGVAHEINTPLGVSITANSVFKERIQTLAQQLEGESLKREELQAFIEQGQDVTEILQNNLQRAADLVNRFKHTAANQYQDELESMNMMDCLHECLATLQPAVDESHVQVTLSGEQGLVLESYPGVWWKIISNLVMNSLHHGFSQGVGGRIDICLTEEAGHLRLTYRDDGKGIAASDLPQVFNPFFTTRRHAGNTGLGLNMVYNLVVQKLQGEIHCYSEPDQGTTFILTLPLTR